MLDSIEVSTTLPASPRQTYDAWLNGNDHTAFTGGEATVDPKQGGAFTAQDGYIEGTNLDWNLTSVQSSPGGCLTSLTKHAIPDLKCCWKTVLVAPS